MNMTQGLHHLRERISHLTHDAWKSIMTTTDHMKTATRNVRRRIGTEPNSTSQDPHNRPH
jgi:hypothetical protein